MKAMRRSLLLVLLSEVQMANGLLPLLLTGFLLALKQYTTLMQMALELVRSKKKLWDTDISLASPKEGISYSCDTFSSNILAGSTLRGFKRLKDVRIGDNIFMDNPFSGRREGQVTKLLWTDIPSEEDASRLPWVGAVWLYTGNGRTDPANGSCGSAFYRFAYDGGKSCTISVEPLMQMGMVIKPIKSSTNTW